MSCLPIGGAYGVRRLGASDVRLLLDEMINQPVPGHLIEGRWCGDIDAPVFSSVQIESPYKIQIKSSFARPEGGVALGFSPDLHSEFGGLGCTNAQDCVEKLVAYAAQHVEEGHFSRHYNETMSSYEYVAFREKDLEFIRQTILRSECLRSNRENT